MTTSLPPCGCRRTDCLHRDHPTLIPQRECRRETPAPRKAPDPVHDQLVERVESIDLESATVALRGVLELAREHELNALRWQDQLPVPTWVGQVRIEIIRALDQIEDQDRKEGTS